MEVGPPAAADGQRMTPTPFLTKTYQLVDDPSVDDVISWNEDGSAFVVWRPAEFARDILPKYFKHNNFSSFVRQLNTYGFRKMVGDRWEFANDCFRRGQKRLLCDIQRRKMTTSAAPPPAAGAISVAPPVKRGGSSWSSGDNQDISSNSSRGSQPPAVAAAAALRARSGSGTVELEEDNDRLRRENEKLSQELGHMKSLCNNILNLISRYASGDGDAVDAGGGGDRVTSSFPPLDLMPTTLSTPDEAGPTKVEERSGSGDGTESTRLFGVSIRLKRSRGDDGEDGAMRSTPEAQPERLDPAPDELAEDPRRWLLQCRRRPNQRVCDG